MNDVLKMLGCKIVLQAYRDCFIKTDSTNKYQAKERRLIRADARRVINGHELEELVSMYGIAITPCAIRRALRNNVHITERILMYANSEQLVVSM